MRLNFEELVRIAGDEPVFETSLLLASDVVASDVQRQSSRWATAGRVHQGRRGLYALTAPFCKVKAHPAVVANRLVRGSSVSCQSALSESYSISIKVSDHRTVHGACVHFPGLLYDLGLLPHRSEALSIKIEVDANPPQGAGLTTTIVRRYVTLQLQHHGRASLLAGKLHAILQKLYVKGRDLYDLLWYLSNPSWPSPNLPLTQRCAAPDRFAGRCLDRDDLARRG